jgi:hypothetical protein
MREEAIPLVGARLQRVPHKVEFFSAESLSLERVCNAFRLRVNKLSCCCSPDQQLTNE